MILINQWCLKTLIGHLSHFYVDFVKTTLNLNKVGSFSIHLQSRVKC